jgi:hypothetical protein
MRVDVSGTRNGQEWPRRGSVIELPDTEAMEYCASGMAEPVTTFAPVETATMPPAELRDERGPELRDELRTDTESGGALVPAERRGPGRPRKTPAT